MTNDRAKTMDLSFLRGRAVLKRIAMVTAGFAVAGALYGLLAPRWYRSELVVVPGKSQKSGGLASLLGGDLAGLAANMDSPLGGGAETARIAAVLKSNAVSDAVIEKFDLKARYDEKYQELARDELWRHCSVRTIPKPNLVELSCEDKDPRFVLELLRYFAELGNDVFRRVNVGSASEEARFLERRVVDLRKQADEAATRIREFQETHQIVDLDSQARALVTSVAAVNAQRITKKMELDYARRFAARDEASTRQLESQLSIVNETLRDLEVQHEDPSGTATAGTPAKGGSRGLFPAAMAVPRLRAEFEKLYRDRKVAEATLVFALDRLEGARAAEARDVSTFQVLDPPTLPTRRTRPRTSVSVAVAALAGLLAAVAFELWKNRTGAK
jgi:uncharacterized protein involved in exopolysaccharide biosynthesis